MTDEPSLTAFKDGRRLATGSVQAIAEALSKAKVADGAFVVFDDATGRPVDLDLRSSASAAVRQFRAPAAAPGPTPAPATRGRGRPRLGVVAREVTLLPRHWDWLATQPGGASAALRRLVEEARRTHTDADRIRQRRDAAYHVMSALGGNLPDFEEAARALFAGDIERLRACQTQWPDDVRDYVMSLLAPPR